MAQPIADDWKAINDRMQQIEAERSPPRRRCPRCNDSGWMPESGGTRQAFERGVCDVCHNPQDLPRPGLERRGAPGLGMRGI